MKLIELAYAKGKKMIGFGKMVLKATFTLKLVFNSLSSTILVMQWHKFVWDKIHSPICLCVCLKH